MVNSRVDNKEGMGIILLRFRELGFEKLRGVENELSG